MISVCIATYNGEKYLEEQLVSILPQIGPSDELIISDDGSVDETLNIIKNYQEQDQRIKFFKGPGKGVIANFEFAIKQSQGEFVFLADQDDVWLPEKVQIIIAFFQKHPKIDLVISDLVIVNESLDVIEASYFDYRNVKLGFIHNIVKNKYIGAGMAFRGTLKKEILPIPNNVPMHDMWIGLIAASKNKSAMIPQKLTLYRRHASNASEIDTGASRYQQLKWRMALIIALIGRKILKVK
ncbi:alpha-L-Rha alpha-1,3-L-rhamnosyltransferase [Enterococcus ureilyticus]|uniref:Alpha-L-Rha alpha-1,3-L-rhamnosyltransferase n=1 Tax=Enterococcus ureilyticus TaxID=1131292 RepID=A0A1E5HAH0_9ENTE|nr:glycosyltransferase family 2 protein [Enterococcus ureilyticus]MBM7688905.1 glycosyltransferase involved in cell wall biosynthesis [Enterococcus ureilyticus]MBO0445526.1 glycosyltransferase family 2 protein [Enterococcus ureilyticus]OEG21948.1 alpha-L-Rha alpha-1,3-L-rhamnosyltransferase [Enterococcus ureilyticus]